MKSAEKTLLYRELAKLTAADFHLDRSLVLLLGQSVSKERRAYLEGAQRGLVEGRSLAEAIRVHNGAMVTGLELSLIEAGERSGKLSAAFTHLARYFAAEDEARRQMRGALVYPLILLHLAIVLPEVPAAIAQTGGEGFLLRVGGLIVGLWLALLGLGWLWSWLVQRALTSAAVDAGLNRLPLVGAVRRHWALARFCQVFHSGLLAALRMSEITRMAGEAAQSGVMRAGGEAAAERIEDGETLALALADAGGFDRLFVNSVATAEEVGKLDEEMARWAQAEAMSAREALQRLTLWLPKGVYAVVALFVIYRIFKMVQGYYAGIQTLIDGM